MLDKAQRNYRMLTAQEQVISLLVCTGMRYQEIADSLGVSHHTVKNHLAHIRMKLVALDTTHIPRRLIEAGYLKANELPIPVYRASDYDKNDALG
jgi:DNA-binding CsgD family transcriptional regulator